MLLLTSTAYAASPVIFYSDLTSGPKTGGQSNNGVFVTIWGNNFGASQGSSTVTVGGGAVASYQTWTNTMVCFQLGASAATGNIVLTTSAGASNGISFTVQSGAIYFVDPTQGSNGSGTYASPFNHLWYAYNIQAAGDTVYVRAGSITDEIDGYGGWHSILAENGAPATSGSPIAWVAYPNETVTLTATGGAPTWSQGSSGAGGESQTAYIFRNIGYIVVSKLNLRFTGSSANLQSLIGGGCGARIVGNDLSATVYTYGEIDYQGGACVGEILGNTIHDSGANYGSTQNQSHSIYIDGPNNPFEVAWNYMYNNQKKGWEISNYQNCPRIGTIHDNLIIANSAGSDKGILADGAGDGMAGNPDTASTMYTNNVKVYNNILVNTGQNNNGGDIQTVCGTNYIYNNTVYGSGTESQGMIQETSYSCGPSGGNEVFYMANNILYGNVSGLYISNTNGSAPTWADFVVLADNIYYGEGNGPTQDTTAINANPQLVSPTTNTSGNWQLQSSSPAIGAGYNTNSVVSSDYVGLTRPTSPAVGAYEYATGGGGGGGGTTTTLQSILSGKLILSGKVAY